MRDSPVFMDCIVLIGMVFRTIRQITFQISQTSDRLVIQRMVLILYPIKAVLIAEIIPKVYLIIGKLSTHRIGVRTPTVVLPVVIFVALVVVWSLGDGVGVFLRAIDCFVGVEVDWLMFDHLMLSAVWFWLRLFGFGLFFPLDFLAAHPLPFCLHL